MTDASGPTGQLKTSVVSLLELHDEAFVRAAYLAILGREVDPDGLANYVGQVRTGESQVQIIAALALSPEGRKHAAQIAGLVELLASPRQTKHSIWARLFKHLTAAAMEPLLRQLRIIANTAARIDSSLQTQSRQLSELARLLERDQPSPVAPPVRPAAESTETRRGVQTSRLGPGLGRLLAELKAAITVKRGH